MIARQSIGVIRADIFLRLGVMVACGMAFLNRITPPARAQSPDEKSRVCIMDADGGNLKPIARIEPYIKHNAPRWSPDGGEILFEAAWKPTGEYDPRIFKVALDGSQPLDMGPGKHASWSPDGKQIVFRMPPEAGDEGVWVMNADGSSRQHLYLGWLPFFSSDGGRIISTDNHDMPDSITIHDLLDGTNRKINHGYEHIPGYASWSPDGKQICFVGHTDGRPAELAIVSATDEHAQPKVRLADDHLTAWPCWGPTGKILVILQSDGATNQPYTIDPNTNDPPQPLPHLDQSQTYRDATWSPDGKQIVVVTGQNR
jgi:Tol biopolymer transport system component